MPRQKAQIGMYVTWQSSSWFPKPNYGIIQTLKPIYIHPLSQDSDLLYWNNLRVCHRGRFLTDKETQRVKHDVYQILLGRLQYNQSFFKNFKHKRGMKIWRQGYQSYKQLCKKYDVKVA